MEDQYHNPVNNLIESIDDLRKVVTVDVTSALKQTQSEMVLLEDSGLIYAAPYWRNNKYLYLLYPQRNKVRVRRYVGADEEVNTRTVRQTENAKQHDLLSAKVKLLNSIMLVATDQVLQIRKRLQAWVSSIRREDSNV